MPTAPPSPRHVDDAGDQGPADLALHRVVEGSPSHKQTMPGRHHHSPLGAHHLDHTGWRDVTISEAVVIAHAPKVTFQNPFAQSHRPQQSADTGHTEANGPDAPADTAQDVLPDTPLLPPPNHSLDGTHTLAGDTAQSRTAVFQGSRRSTIFYRAHGSRKPSVDITHADEQTPIHLRHLFRRPVIRQFISAGKLYREKFERESFRFELFFDLAFVGITHQLADGLAESEGARGLNIAKFALTLYPCYSIWLDVRTYVNQSGLDDVVMRCVLLLYMLLSIGYISNATACRIVPESAGQPLEHNSIRRSHAHSHPEEVPRLATRIGATNYWFVEGYFTAITAAIGFYLAAKSVRLLTLFIYGTALPNFRRALWLQCIPVVILAVVYLMIPALQLKDPSRLVAMLTAGAVIDALSKYAVSYLCQWWHRRTKRSNGTHATDHSYLPVQSVEHLAERWILFILLVIGESVLNSTYSAGSQDTGLSQEFGRSALSVVVAFCLIWVYFDIDASRVFLHALRRSPATSITFNLLHYPLVGALIMTSSAVVKLVHENHSSQADRWFYGGSLAAVMGLMAVLGLLHKNLDRAGTALWDRHARIILRLLVAAMFAIIPIPHGLSNLEFIAVYAVLSAVLVASETLGKLGVVGRRFDAVKADKLYAGLEAERAMAREQSKVALEDFEMGETLRRRAGQAERIERPTRRSSWHEHDDLFNDEQGNEDVGIEGEIGNMEVKERLVSDQRWALLAL